MKCVGDVMTEDVFLVTPEQTIAEAALLMREKDVGSVAVHREDKLVGMLTDRDITLRAVAENLAPATPVQEIMSEGIKYCFEDQDVDEVAANMAELEIRRLPVVNREKRLVGIIALSNMAFSEEPESTSVYLESVACPH
ncbi:MAG TPA: CBS domain-containing protein [Rhodanobacteraceae bacterium]|jgi:CBS domain-containing protein|nr:CBS domain-containing protein [Rhodanobacteraceae bacterium]